MRVTQKAIETLLASGLSQRRAARELGISLGMLQRTFYNGDRQSKETQKTDAKLLRQYEVEIGSLREQLARRDAAAAEAELAETKRFEPLIISPERHEPGAPGIPMALWSDWHWGETVDPRQMGGLNEFNREVAELRVKRLVERLLDLCFNYTGAKMSDEHIVVCLGGDMVSGLIHEELVATNWGNIADQVEECGSAIVGALYALADAFKRVTVIAGVPGNHGRTTPKPTAKGRLDSYDRTIYRRIGNQLAGDPRFETVFCDDIDYRFQVSGRWFLLTHGDSQGVRGGDGIIGAYGPIIRGFLKVKAAEQEIGRHFDYMLQGHWHQYIPAAAGLPVITNGTLKGYCEFARVILRAKFARPCQAMWLVSPKHGVVGQQPIYLD